jgi:predicted Zn-ribbon and HTH transcriptional regulator
LKTHPPPLESAPNARIMGAMRTQDPHGGLSDGFEPSEVARAPDGGPAILPLAPDPPPARPSLCRAGPCRRYHRLVTQVDAENPRAQKIPMAVPEGTPFTERVSDGTIFRAPAVFHVQVHHYCYPDTGIEMPLGDLPVVECNRWEPKHKIGERLLFRQDVPECRQGAIDDAPTDDARTFLLTQQGQEYLASVEDWERARAREAAAATEAEQLIRAYPVEVAAKQIVCQGCGRSFDEAELDVRMYCPTCRSPFSKKGPP